MSSDRKVSTKILDVVMNPMYTLKHNWQNGTSAKVGTITGAATGTILGGSLGGVLGTTTIGATIGSFVFPGFGTVIGGGIGVCTGIFLSSIPGAIIGSEIGHTIDVKRQHAHESVDAFDHGIIQNENIELDISLDSPRSVQKKMDENTFLNTSIVAEKIQEVQQNTIDQVLKSEIRVSEKVVSPTSPVDHLEDNLSPRSNETSQDSTKKKRRPKKHQK